MAHARAAESDPAVRPADPPEVNRQVAALSAAPGEPMPANRALAAPWVGRPRNRAGEPMSSGTSEGWRRSHSCEWKVTPDRAARWGWSARTIGQKRIHHHIEKRDFGLPVPENLHQGRSGDIHARVTVEVTW